MDNIEIEYNVIDFLSEINEHDNSDYEIYSDSDYENSDDEKSLEIAKNKLSIVD